LERSNKSLTINTFQDAEDALKIIRESRNKKSKRPTIVLLDLLMPGMSGFKFVEEFEKFPAEIQKMYRIIILTVLSSNSHPIDIHRVLNNGTVHSVIEKPLTKEKLISLLDDIEPGQ